MNIDYSVLKNDERAIFGLRSLYSRYGYSQYKMNKFEEYDLYVRNKDFLVSDNIITFTDTSGKLMALKPDVTLSIIKNGKDVPGVLEKVYYDENVEEGSSYSYRIYSYREEEISPACAEVEVEIPLEVAAPSISKSASYRGRRYGSTLLCRSPGRKPRRSPASTAGRVRMMRFTCSARKAATASLSIIARRSS